MNCHNNTEREVLTVSVGPARNILQDELCILFLRLSWVLVPAGTSWRASAAKASGVSTAILCDTTWKLFSNSTAAFSVSYIPLWSGTAESRGNTRGQCFTNMSLKPANKTTSVHRVEYVNKNRRGYTAGEQFKCSGLLKVTSVANNQQTATLLRLTEPKLMQSGTFGNINNFGQWKHMKAQLLTAIWQICNEQVKQHYEHGGSNFK